MKFGILQPKDYHGEVTGTVIMMSQKTTQKKNSKNSDNDASPPSITLTPTDNQADDGLKRTRDGIVLHPQPQNDPNDPLNWPVWKRDIALGVIGFQSFIIGGMSPLLAAAFTIMSEEFDVPQTTLAYLVGAYMLSMGIGSVFFAPTAVLYGKRLVYIIALVVFLAGCLVGGASNSFKMLLGARIIMGIGGAPTESLPSASIAEIYFLHERAYRLGIYTLLMLGGKNLVPMVAGFIIGDLSWNWVFWILALIAGLNLLLTFFFVPETWWDRTPIPNKRSIKESELAQEARANSMMSRVSSLHESSTGLPISTPDALRIRNQHQLTHRPDISSRNPSYGSPSTPLPPSKQIEPWGDNAENSPNNSTHNQGGVIHDPLNPRSAKKSPPPRFQLDNNLHHSPSRAREDDDSAPDYFNNFSSSHINHTPSTPSHPRNNMVRKATFADEVNVAPNPPTTTSRPVLSHNVSSNSAMNPKKSYWEQLTIFNGRFTNDQWWMVAMRPFFLYAYPGILFSTFIYSFSVVWLIVISETISKIFSAEPYNFPTTSVGLLYIATFIGGCLGSAVAGRASDLVVRVLSRRNGGVYEPEFRIVMIVPVFLAVTIGMMGFGWSSFEKDLWIVPAIFLSILGFGCSLGSTTAITYAVDSYKMFAAEALVTLNLTKNLFGFFFSLFVPKFLEESGPRTIFVVFGCIQIGICLMGIPVFIFGKRMRHWTDNVDMMKSLYVLDDDFEQDDESKSSEC